MVESRYKKDILGKVKYRVVSATEVIKEIEIRVPKSYKERIMRDHYERSAIILVIDKSGSMRSVIDSVKKASKEILTHYLSMREI
jgi:Mg-chelatase subunit ChlD